VKKKLEELVDELRPRCGNAKWVAPENLHLTVRFLGEVDEGRVGSLEALAKEVAREFTPFSLELERLSAFPSPRRARVLWIGPAGIAEEFVALMQLVEEEVRRLGFRPEMKEPKVHVTLSRFKIPRDISRVIEEVSLNCPLQVNVRDLTLMQSVLRPEGPLYIPVLRVPLGGG